MADLPPILPNQRVVFVGRTGSGKTFLARALLQGVTRLIVLDAKGTLSGDEWNLEPYDDSFDFADPEATFRMRVPSPMDGNWEPYIWSAYYAGNCTIYVDEVYGVESGTKPTLAMRAVITRGRELGVGVWAATQRPSYIPMIILSEADWLFEFQLRLETDRQRMASLIGPAGLTELRNHELIVYNDALEKPIKYKQAKVTNARAVSSEKYQREATTKRSDERHEVERVTQ